MVQQFVGRSLLRFVERFELEQLPAAVDPAVPMDRVSRAMGYWASGAEQKCTTREVIGQRKCPRQLFGRSVTEAGWQHAGRVSEDGFWRDLWVV